MSAPAFVGKNVALSISYNTTTPAYTLLGGCTTKSHSLTIDNVDVTSDDSPGSFREFVETYVGGSFSFSVYPGKDETRRAAVDALEEFIIDPSSQSKTNREVVLKVVRPKSDISGAAQTRTTVATYLITGISEEMPHDGAAAFSFEATQISESVITDAAV